MDRLALQSRSVECCVVSTANFAVLEQVTLSLLPGHAQVVWCADRSCPEKIPICSLHICAQAIVETHTTEEMVSTLVRFLFRLVCHYLRLGKIVQEEKLHFGVELFRVGKQQQRISAKTRLLETQDW